MSAERDAHFARYQRAAHAMQSAVALSMGMPGHNDGTRPKHLRVGVNTALVDQGALVKVLIAKGLLTEEEYAKALADGMEAEVERYKRDLHLPPSVNFA